ncbi:MAG: TatD family hydrolase [Gemmatimonas sp.]
MTVFADSHVHLADHAFAHDVDAVVERACIGGARALVCIGESAAAARRAQSLSSRYPGLVFHTCGVHPHDAAGWDADRDAEAIRESVNLGGVAIGECGLDYHYETAPREQQRRVLTAQLSLAAELARPIVLHTRNAEEDTLAFLRDAATAGVRGVLHCFTGSVALAQAGLEAGWLVSFSGIVTFRAWKDEALLRMVPDHCLLVESDAPYLAPMPHRGKRNEPAFVVRTLAHLAAVRGTSIEQLAKTTFANTARFFSLSVSSLQRFSTLLPQQ